MDGTFAGPLNVSNAFLKMRKILQRRARFMSFNNLIMHAAAYLSRYSWYLIYVNKRLKSSVVYLL